MYKKLTEEEIVDSIDTAIREGYIFPYFQPQINHSTGRMIGAEALMRWEDPEFGM